MRPFVPLPLLSNRYIMRQQGQIKADDVPSVPEPPMHLAVVACGDRLEETLTMAKSAVLFSVKRLHVHIFAEDQLHATFMEAVSCANRCRCSDCVTVRIFLGNPPLVI